MQLVAMAVPHVEGAPCLGGHNRGELPPDIATPEAAAAYLETLSSQPVDPRRYHCPFCELLQALRCSEKYVPAKRT